MGGRLCIGEEAPCRGVRQIQIDAREGEGMPASGKERINQLEQENPQWRETNAVLKDTAVFSAAELDPRRR